MDSETTFKAVLDGMMSKFMEHSTLVAASTERTSASAKEAIVQVILFVYSITPPYSVQLYDTNISQTIINNKPST